MKFTDYGVPCYKRLGLGLELGLGLGLKLKLGLGLGLGLSLRLGFVIGLVGRGAYPYRPMATNMSWTNLGWGPADLLKV